jgi:hypothetical protein
MIVGCYFPGDNNDLLMVAQHDCYSGGPSGERFELGGYTMDSCVYLFYAARQAFLSKTDSNPLFFPERDSLISISSFDHRVLQNGHDLIAAHYRWLVSNARRPHTMQDELSYKQYLAGQWKDYFIREVSNIVWNNLAITEHIVRAVAFANTPLGYDSEDELGALLLKRYGPDFAEGRKAILASYESDPSRHGWVYVAVNPALKDSYLKIGWTRRPPQERAAEISSGTGVPLRYYILFAMRVSDGAEVERQVHSQLGSYRLTTNREFFEVSLDHATDVIRKTAALYPPAVPDELTRPETT